MEVLKITNFLCIEHAEIEIKKINLFIGEQAQGKSVIAKLIYFFKNYPQTLIESVYRGISSKDSADKLVLDTFKKIFPEYTWINTNFKIEYSNKYYKVIICCQDEKLDLTSDFIFREIFTTLHDAKWTNPSLENYKFNSNNFLLYQGKKIITAIISEHFSFLDAVLIENLFKDNNKPYVERNYYIPAGRSFFATLSNNLFYFINNNDVQLDYFLKSFGLAYQKIKRDKLWYKGMYFENKENRLTQLVKQIIAGESVFEDEQDWIVDERGKINLANASSGQQESLPITTILLRTPYCHNSYINNHFVIEEPEAHLFPKAQNDIVCLIANAYTDGVITCEDRVVNTFTSTTHSPYILTAFNNLIQAGNVAKSKNYQNLDELYKVIPKHELINFDDVSAYFVEKGTVKSILDHELKLIDAHAIDGVSRQFAQIFEKLVMMEENND